MDVNALVRATPNANVQKVAPGDSVKVVIKVIEGEKTRSQTFLGVVIRVMSGKNDANFTVRRVTQGVGVERTFMVNSPLLEKVEVTRSNKVRRAKLFYLRALSAKEARLKERARVVEELAAAAPVAAGAAEVAAPEAEAAVAKTAVAAGAAPASAEAAKSEEAPKA